MSDFRINHQTLSEALASCDGPQPNFIIDGLLQAGGISVFISKPKLGKTSQCVQLACQVASGRGEWLGRKILDAGDVLFLALEEPNRVQFINRVADMCKFRGLTPEERDRIHLYTAPIIDRGQTIPSLKDAIEHIPNLKLIVIDTLVKALPIRDLDSYGEVTGMWTQLDGIINNTAVHLLLVHHAKKVSSEHGPDNSLGTTAILSNAATALYMDPKGNKRTIYSVQKYGEALTPHYLDFDADDQITVLGEAVDAAEERVALDTQTQINDALFQSVATHTDIPYQALIDGVNGKAVKVRLAIQSLLDKGLIVRSGEGVKGDPYVYNVAKVVYEA